MLKLDHGGPNHNNVIRPYQISPIMMAMKPGSSRLNHGSSATSIGGATAQPARWQPFVARADQLKIFPESLCRELAHCIDQVPPSIWPFNLIWNISTDQSFILFSDSVPCHALFQDSDILVFLGVIIVIKCFTVIKNRMSFPQLTNTFSLSTRSTHSFRKWCA